MCFSLSLHFLPVLSLQASVCLVLSCFSGVIMSIRSFSLFIRFFSSVTSLTSTVFRRFSMVLPDTELFISLKKC